MGEISRRAMLGGTGKLAVVAGAGTQLGWATVRPRRPRPDWDALARQLRGRLLRPGDRGYLVASVPYNKRYAAIRPGGVALCADAADVRAALRWARRYGVPFAARSGAHSYGGYSASRGLLISLARMNSVRVDRRSMTISAGRGRPHPGAVRRAGGHRRGRADRPVPDGGPQRAAARRRLRLQQPAPGPHL